MLAAGAATLPPNEKPPPVVGVGAGFVPMLATVDTAWVPPNEKVFPAEATKPPLVAVGAALLLLPLLLLDKEDGEVGAGPKQKPELLVPKLFVIFTCVYLCN